jgi:ElaB/YqjD/DUF883 family membrane-anchored ribosome-binding protein
MSSERQSDDKLDRLVAVLVEETLAMSDEEILADVVDDAGETERALRAEIAAAIAEHRRQRLMDAKKAVATRKTAPRLVPRPGGDLRAAVARVIANNNASFTLAACDGRDVPDADLDGLAEDLRDLGFDVSGEEDPDAS